MRERGDVFGDETGVGASASLNRRRPGAFSGLPWAAVALALIVSLTACAGGSRLEPGGSSRVGAGEYLIKIENFESSEVSAVQSALNRACHNGAQPIKKSPDLAELRFRPCGGITVASVDGVIGQALKDIGIADQAAVSFVNNTFIVSKTLSGMWGRIACKQPANKDDLYIGWGIAYMKKDEELSFAIDEATFDAQARVAEQRDAAITRETERRRGKDERGRGEIFKDEVRRRVQARLKGSKTHPPAFGRGGQVCVLVTIEKAKVDEEINSAIDDFLNRR